MEGSFGAITRGRFSLQRGFHALQTAGRWSSGRGAGMGRIWLITPDNGDGHFAVLNKSPPV